MSRFASEERLREVMDFYFLHGERDTLATFGLKQDSLRRYKNQFRRMNPDLFRQQQLTRKLVEKFGEEQLKAMAKGSGERLLVDAARFPEAKGSFKFLHVTDTHFGNRAFSEALWKYAVETGIAEGVDAMVHGGDVTDGFSHRPGHVFEQTHVGYAQQKAYAEYLFEMVPFPVYLVDGNHDRWYEKAVGARIVEEICKNLDHVTFLGQDEGYLLVGPVKLSLWHGEDGGGSYAKSYRGQKIIRAMEPEELPDVMCLGHDHKRVEFEDNGVQIIGGGSLCYQTKWMRRTLKKNDAGFHINTITFDDDELLSVEHKWYPAPKRWAPQIQEVQI